MRAGWVRRGDLELEVELLAPDSATRVLVALDFDGTLSAVVMDPERAQPAPGAIQVLGRLATAAAGVLVISGRAQGDLERLLPVAGVDRRGDFGLMGATAAEHAALEACAADLMRLLAAEPALRLEVKPGALSVHHRSRPTLGPELLAACTPVAAAHGLLASPGRAVVEIRPMRADKALAVADMITRTRPDSVLYAGDDEADRSVFGMLAAGPGPSLRVGVDSREATPGLFDLCQVVVSGPLGVVEVLRRLAGRLGRSGHAGPGVGG